MADRDEITRRQLLRDAGAGLLTVSLLGCGGGGGTGPGGADASSGASDGGGGVGDGGGDARPPTCGEVTADNIEGPFFTPDSPERPDLTEPGMEGTRLRVTGRVVDTACNPIAGATLDFWQANDAGEYDNQGDTLRGHQLTGADGTFQLDTIIPGRYLNGDTYRPAHVHVKVGASGFPLLTTQLYFEGDPYNESDPFIVDSLIMSLADGPDGRKDAEFDFVLARG